MNPNPFPRCTQDEFHATFRSYDGRRWWDLGVRSVPLATLLGEHFSIWSFGDSIHASIRGDLEALGVLLLAQPEGRRGEAARLVRQGLDLESIRTLAATGLPPLAAYYAAKYGFDPSAFGGELGADACSPFEEDPGVYRRLGCDDPAAWVRYATAGLTPTVVLNFHLVGVDDFEDMLEICQAGVHSGTFREMMEATGRDRERSLAFAKMGYSSEAAKCLVQTQPSVEEILAAGGRYYLARTLADYYAAGFHDFATLIHLASTDTETSSPRGWQWTGIRGLEDIKAWQERGLTGDYAAQCSSIVETLDNPPLITHFATSGVAPYELMRHYTSFGLLAEVDDARLEEIRAEVPEVTFRIRGRGRMINLTLRWGWRIEGVSPEDQDLLEADRAFAALAGDTSRFSRIEEQWRHAVTDPSAPVSSLPDALRGAVEPARRAYIAEVWYDAQAGNLWDATHTPW